MCLLCFASFFPTLSSEKVQMSQLYLSYILLELYV